MWARQRHRFTAVLRGFGPGDWAAPTRCADWCAHDVVRHLCDRNAIAAGADPEDRTLDFTAGYDPRITPRGWPAVSANESPDATVSRLLATTGDLFTLLRGRLARGVRFDVCLPHGPMNWTILVLQAFWDSWLHERDVLLARGREHPTDGDATGYATARAGAVALEMVAEQGDELGVYRDAAGLAGGTVFELTALRRSAVVGPAGAAAGLGVGQQHLAQPSSGMSVRLLRRRSTASSARSAA